ncbi:MAG: hypothetical protein FWH21_04130 [Kiritimatiellaeota bacterium]|nr:hypothetical protein [Kiritimatiellota bacterium]
MKKLLTYSSCTLLSACSLFAETAWFGTIEVSSLQGLQTGIETFAKAAEIPLPEEGIPNLVSLFFENTLPIASPATAISLKDTIRVFLLEDTEDPLSDGGEPEAVLSFTLPGEIKVLQDQLAKLYGTRRDAGNVVTLTDPVRNLPENLLLAAAENGKALVATSKEALDWFQKQQKLDAFLPVAGNQTIKACINVKQMAGIMEDFPMRGGGGNFAVALMNDIEYFSFALTPNAQALTLTYGLRFKEGSVLATLANAVKPPDAVLWNGLPENALFGYVGQQSMQADAAKIVETYFKQPIPLDPTQVKLEQAITSDLIRYLVPTADKKAFRLIDVNPVKDAAAVKEIIKALDQNEAAGFKKESSREIGQQTIERYSLVIDPATLMRQAQGIDPAMFAPGGNPAVAPVMALLSTLTKGIVMECTVKDNYFLSAIGPADATDDWLPAIPFPAPTVTLDKKLAADPTAKPLLQAGEVNLTPLLRQLISMLPNVKPEHLNLFAAKTDAIQFWASRTPDNTTIATVRIPANEVASIIKVATNGQAVLQELIFSFFTTRMMPMMMQPPQQPPAVQPPPNF